MERESQGDQSVYSKVFYNVPPGNYQYKLRYGDSWWFLDGATKTGMFQAEGEIASYFADHWQSRMTQEMSTTSSLWNLYPTQALFRALQKMRGLGTCPGT